MPDNTLTEEQEQVRRLLQCWRKVNNLFAQVLFGSLIVLPTELMLIFWLRGVHLPSIAISIISFLYGGGLSIGLLLYYASKHSHFIWDMTHEERELLEHTLHILGESDRKAAIQLLKQSEEASINPEKHLLRASEQTETDLLRSAPNNES